MLRKGHPLLMAVLILFACGCPDSAPPSHPGTPVLSPATAPTSAPKGIALCIGLNSLDPSHYANWDGRLFGCEHDATDMAAIAHQSGFVFLSGDHGKLITKNATRGAVLQAIRAACRALKSGDIFMISYSGHGDEVPDPQAPAVNQGMDQTWCLYDGMLLDKELYAEWSHFADGVRILVFSDSCHSAGITRAPTDYVLDVHLMGAPALADPPRIGDRQRLMQLKDSFTNLVRRHPNETLKLVPPEVSIAAYAAERTRYEGIVRDVERPGTQIHAWVLSITACKNEQTAGDRETNGVFTIALKQVWNNGAFQGDYVKFHADIAAAAAILRPAQEAQRRMVDADHDAYWQQRPFTIQSH